MVRERASLVNSLLGPACQARALLLRVSLESQGQVAQAPHAGGKPE